MRVVRVLTLLVAVVVASGCNNHVYPPTLPAGMSADQRLDVWRHWHSRGMGVEIATTCGNNGCRTERTAILELEGGVRVRHPEDLRPLLPEASESSRALQRVEHEKSSRVPWTVVAVAGALGMLVSGIATIQTENESVLIYGGGTSLAVAAIGGIGIWIKNQQILETSLQVYDGYDAALAQRLDLCVRGLTIVPCEMDTPGTMSVPAN